MKQSKGRSEAKTQEHHKQDHAVPNQRHLQSGTNDLKYIEDWAGI